MKCWYQNASARAPNPSQTNMEKFRGDSQTLYHQEDPHCPDLPLATHMEPVQVNNATPLDAEV